MSDDIARGILVAGARALARGEAVGTTLTAILDALAPPLDILSAAVVTVDPAGGRPDIVATYGLDDEAAGGLAQAVANPGHPIRRTATDPTATFDVLPTAPGGPALRSHVPLAVVRNGASVVLGVLALAHDRPIDPASRQLIQAAADLAAVAIERHPAR
jgi:GAF domain-containing protein